MTGLLHGGSEHRVYIYRRRRVVNTRYRGIYRGVRTSDPRLVRVHGTGSDGAGDPVGGSAQRQVGEDEVLVVKSQWRVRWRLMARKGTRNQDGEVMRGGDAVFTQIEICTRLPEPVDM
jgi:hypothetical protein